MVNFSANFQTMMALVVLPYSQANHLLRFNQVNSKPSEVFTSIVTKAFINMSKSIMQEMLDYRWNIQLFKIEQITNILKNHCGLL